MSVRKTAETVTPATSLEIRGRLVEALQLDLVGPRAGHAFAAELLPGWVRPSTWYLTGFLIPSGTPAEKNADADEDDEFELVGETSGLAEESNEDRRAAWKGHFPSSMGLSFLASREARALTVTVRWGDYAPGRVEGEEGKLLNLTEDRSSSPIRNLALAAVVRRFATGPRIAPAWNPSQAMSPDRLA